VNLYILSFHLFYSLRCTCKVLWLEYYQLISIKSFQVAKEDLDYLNLNSVHWLTVVSHLVQWIWILVSKYLSSLCNVINVWLLSHVFTFNRIGLTYIETQIEVQCCMVLGYFQSWSHNWSGSKSSTTINWAWGRSTVLFHLLRWCAVKFGIGTFMTSCNGG